MSYILQAKKFDEAEKFGKKILKLQPDDVDTLVDMSHVASKLKKIKEGEKYLRQVIQKNPNLGIAVYNMACFKALKNSADEAIVLLSKAITLDKKYKQQAISDPDFSNIKNNPEFSKLLNGE